MIRQFLKSKLVIQIIFASVAATLATALIVSATTTIGSNVSTDGSLVISGITATSTFSTGGLAMGANQFVVQQTSGNVGIGTDKPRSVLDITGEISLHGNFLYDNKFIQLKASETSASNAASYLTTPTYDGSNQAVHPDIYYNPLKWPNANGYKFWMAMTPYPTGNATYENPSILASNDGQTWVVPAGLTNPIEAAPASGHYDDPDIIRGKDGKLYVFFVLTGSSSPYPTTVYVKSSADGITWSDKTEILTSEELTYISPAVIIDNGVYTMWSINATVSPAVFEKRTASSPTGPWSSATALTVNGIASDRDIWHVDVVKTDNEYHAFFVMRDVNTGGGNAKINFATSPDGITWALNSATLLDKSVSGNWDDTYVYRASAILLDVGYEKRYALWYSARNASTEWHIGYTEVYLGTIVNSSGNIGIGTSSPITKLSIQGTSGANNVLNIASSTGSTLLHINAAGNVGIGTANPQAILDTNGRLRVLSSSAANPTSGKGLEITYNSGNDTAYIFAYDRGGAMYQNIAIGKNSTQLYLASSTAYVGIGTNAPASKLSVVGGISAGTYYTTAAPANGMIISGSVGIGTTSPAATLDVEGYMRLKKNTSQPAACSTANAGAIALNSAYLICSCNGASWINAASSTEACVW